MNLRQRPTVTGIIVALVLVALFALGITTITANPGLIPNWPPGKPIPTPNPSPTPTATLVPAPTVPTRALPPPAIAPTFRSQNITVTNELLFPADLRPIIFVWNSDDKRLLFSQLNGKRIAVAGTNGEYPLKDLLLINADGTGLTRLASNVVYFDWSKDGTEVTYTSFVNEKQGDVFVSNADGNGLRKIATGDVARAQFLPDGHVAYVKNHLLNEVDPATGATRQLNPFVMEDFEKLQFPGGVTYGPTADYRVSPDGKRLAYGNTRALYIMNLDGSGLVQLTAASPSVDSFAWSADGLLIAYGVAQQGQRAHLVVAAADGSASQPIYEEAFQVVANSWSPDGNVILALTKNRAFTLNRDGSDVQVLAGEGLSRASMGTWSPKGDKMIVRRGDRIGVASIAH